MAARTARPKARIKRAPKVVKHLMIGFIVGI